MNQTGLYGKYQQMQVKTADQGTLILMLYDGAIVALKQAQKLLNTKPLNREALADHIVKAKDIIYELVASLDIEVGGEIAEALLNLYSYFIWRVGKASIEQDATYLEDVLKHLQDLQSAWTTIFQEARVQQKQFPSSPSPSQQPVKDSGSSLIVA